MDEKLPVFNVERFALHDGEGIRTAVFFQGCPLRCAWCANPESQSVGRKIMFLSEKCAGCGVCSAHCPRHCIRVRDGKAVIDRERFARCGGCAAACPREALTVSGNWMTGAELLQIILRDTAYYRRTRGGVTLTGGEALLHAPKLVPLLEALRDEGIDIAAETCGHVPPENIEMILPYVNRYLFDLKSMRPHRFRAYTGGDLDKVLRSFERIAGVDPGRIVVRVPVIPAFNAEEEEMRLIFAYAASKGVKRVDLLPYHTLGVSKYRKLGISYPFPVAESMSREDAARFLAVAERDYFLNARID